MCTDSVASQLRCALGPNAHCIRRIRTHANTAVNHHTTAQRDTGHSGFCTDPRHTRIKVALIGTGFVAAVAAAEYVLKTGKEKEALGDD